MKLIGYAGHNVTIGTSASRTARLRNIDEQRLRQLIAENLRSLRRIIEWNIQNDILYYRVTSGLVPYASHPVNRIDWATEFKSVFRDIGRLIRKAGILIAVHPGQYTVLSSPDPVIAQRALLEVEYHNTLLELLETGPEARITIHMGGNYRDKEAAISRWAGNFRRLGAGARSRLAVENDEIAYAVSDCLEVHQLTGVPVAFDTLHHEINPHPHALLAALKKCLITWEDQPAKPEVHFSTQAPGKRPAAHAPSIDLAGFTRFYELTNNLDFNILLETKDKELSVLKVKRALRPLTLGPAFQPDVDEIADRKEETETEEEA